MNLIITRDDMDADSTKSKYKKRILKDLVERQSKVDAISDNYYNKTL